MNSSMKILVVDDFATMRRIVKGSLQQMGFKNIIEADDGDTALIELKRYKIDLILSDWLMPKMSGLELLNAIRNDDGMKTIPFIMVTAEGDKKKVIEAVKAGVDSFVVKPFTPETLKQKIERVFNN